MFGLALLLAAQSTADVNAAVLLLSRRFAMDYAMCVAKNERELAETAVLHAMDDPMLSNLSKAEKRKLISQDCVNSTSRKYPGDSLRFPGYSLYQHLADGLIQQYYPVPAESFAGVPDISHVALTAKTDEPEATRSKTVASQLERDAAYQADYFYDVYADCVARRDPIGVHAVLQTEVAGPEELRAIGTLQQAMADCLPPEKTMKIRVEFLRPALALNYFRLAHALAHGEAVRPDGATS